MRNSITLLTQARWFAGMAFTMALLSPVVARAQDTAPAAPAAPATPAVPPAAFEPFNLGAVYVGDGVTLSTGRNAAELQKKITLEANDMPIMEALKKVAEQIGIPCEFDPGFPSDKKVTVTMKNVPAATVINYLTQEAETGYSFMVKKEDGKESKLLQFGKKRMRGAVSIAGYPGQGTRYRQYDKQYQAQMDEAMKAAQQAARMTTVSPNFRVLRALGGAPLPDTRVKLDVRNSNIRDALKDVLKQAGLDYALEDDVPDGLKRSFTFENVPITTALDVICRSAEVGWTVQLAGGRVAGASAGKTKPVVLIGKKYANRLFTPFGANGVGFDSGLPALLDIASNAVTAVSELPAMVEGFPLLDSISGQEMLDELDLEDILGDPNVGEDIFLDTTEQA